MSEDQHAADVFNSEPISTEAPQSDAPATWDEAESYQPTEPEAETTDEEVTDLFKSEDSDDQAEPTGQEDEDSSEDSTEESAESGEEETEAESEAFELPEQLLEKGLVANEGEIGKMIKIDGEETFVSLAELGNDYSGQQAINRRFTEVDQREKAFEQETSAVEGYINSFGEKLREGDALGAFKYFGEFANLPPHVVERQLIEQLRPKIEEMYNMTPEELSSKYTQEENEYLKQSLESKQQEMEAQQAQEELQAHISEVRETHGIEDSEWDQAISYLQEQEQAILAQNPDIVMDAEFVADFIQDNRAYSRVETAMEASDVNLSENDMDYLHDIAKRNPDFDQNDLVELIKTANRTVVESNVSQSLGNRVAKNGTKPKAKQQQKIDVTPEESAILDDIWG